MGNRKVVDLVGRTDEKYSFDTPTVIFSSGKIIGSVLMSALVDQGLLKSEEKVTTYWPEFG
jgi:CubicO group peptidase (beta-lactamase class C family)